MIRVQFLPGTRDQIVNLANGLVIAVDIGLAKDGGKSCGVAWKFAKKDPEPAIAREFRPAIIKVCDLLKSESIATLIIEAPLSNLFSAAGNPIKRRDFETENTDERPWYRSGGATPCLASIHFLRQIRNHLLSIEGLASDVLIYLYEGFMSFKHGKKTSHKADAEKLLNCFVKGPKIYEVFEVKPEKEQSVIAVTDIITNGCNSSEMPLVLKPSRDAEH